MSELFRNKDSASHLHSENADKSTLSRSFDTTKMMSEHKFPEHVSYCGFSFFGLFSLSLDLILLNCACSPMALAVTHMKSADSLVENLTSDLPSEVLVLEAGVDDLFGRILSRASARSFWFTPHRFDTFFSHL